MVTVGFALDVAHQRATRLVGETSNVLALGIVLVGVIDLVWVMQLVGPMAHVVSVSLDQAMLLEITTANAFVAEATPRPEAAPYTEATPYSEATA